MSVCTPCKAATVNLGKRFLCRRIIMRIKSVIIRCAIRALNIFYNKKKNCIFYEKYVHHFQRFFTGWYHFYTVPPTLLAMLEDHTLAGIQKHALDCLIKVYRLCEYISNAMREKVCASKFM